MSQSDILSLLEKNKNDRGIAVWQRAGVEGMTTYGIGLTQLKQLAKQVPKNHDLALELWQSNVYDAKLMACMIEEPKKVTRQQVDKQVENLRQWGFAYAYCSIVLSKVSFLKDLVVDWASSDNDLLRRCGYLCMYQLAQNDKKLDDAFFEPYISTIESKLQSEENFVKDAMNAALWQIGLRSKNLHEKALAAARKIGKVEVDYGDNSCQAIDIVKHLTNERAMAKFK